MKTYKNLTARLMCILCFLLSSCNKSEVSTEVTILEPTIYRNAFFPLAVGNSWTYIDSMFTSTDTTTTTYTVSIVSFWTDITGTWWKFSTNNSAYRSYSLREQNDSIYSLQYYGNSPFSELEYIPSSSSDTLFIYSSFGRDVSLKKSVFQLSSMYHTPVRTFDSCLVIQYAIGEFHTWEVLRPRIGIVGYDTKVDSFYPHDGWSHKVRLTNYNLKR